MMKKLIYIPLALGILSCDSSAEKIEKHEEVKKNYVSISGKITNLKEGDLVINDYSRAYTKTISVKEDGSFQDTLKVPDSISNYVFTYGEEYGILFLENGDSLAFTLNTEKFDESLIFSGSSAKENNYLVERSLHRGKLDFMKLISAENVNYDNDLEAEVEKMEILLSQLSALNPKLIESEKEEINKFREQATEYHNQAVEQAKIFANLIGKPSPTFVNYTTPEGKLVSLDKFKGKYTYIDVWSTWCGPCKAEIPAMIEFTNTEKAKKINFISLSVDEEKATETWKEMVVEKEMKWHQLKADSSWESSFIRTYAINSIPRFILLDPKGNVVNPNAPRPSSEEFKAMIEGLKL